MEEIPQQPTFSHSREKMDKLEDLLSLLWLQQKEAKIYLICHQYRQATASRIANISGINRTSVYDYAKNLLQKWFLQVMIRNNITYFTAVSPHDILALLESKKKEIWNQELEIKKHISDFNQLQSYQNIVPEVQYFEWVEAIEKFYQEMVESDSSYSLFDLEAIFEYLYHDINVVLKNLSNKSVKCAKKIMVSSEKSIKYKKKIEATNPNIKVKLLPKKYKLQADITFFDGKIYHISYGTIPSVVKIVHPVLYEAQKAQFDYIWDSLK